MIIVMDNSSVPSTGSWHKLDRKFDVCYDLTLYKHVRVIYHHISHGYYHILTKIDREIFWKYFWPMKFEIWIRKHDR